MNGGALGGNGHEKNMNAIGVERIPLDDTEWAPQRAGDSLT